MLHYVLLVGMLLCSFPYFLLGQDQHPIQGKLQDKEGNPIISATVVLFDLADSTITDYTLSSTEGAFKLQGKAQETYEVQVSYLGYDPIIQKITLTQAETLPPLILQESVTTLTTAQIEADHIPIRMNGDTLEFNSGAFNVQAHDDVEALLKQMPGVDIDEQGNVTVNGKKVEKITVDGKDFFGDNAQVALKNLPADAIKKVQSFDKKTDKEELLGKVASGDTKVLNLVLKEDKKSGYMGNVQGGYGYNPNEDKHHYEGTVNLHHFNPALRLSVIGNINNINEAGINFGDYNKVTGGYLSDFMDNNAMNMANAYSTSMSSLIFGNNTIKGAYRIGSGGTSMNFFLSDKTDLSAHYLYSNVFQALNTTVYNRYLLEDNFFTRESRGQDLPLDQMHMASVKLKQQLDSTQQLRLNFRYKHDNQTKQETEENFLFNPQGELSTHLEQEQVSQNVGNSLATSLYYQKKLKKKGRALWFNGVFAFQNQERDWDIFSETELYNNQQISRIDTLSQSQIRQQQEQVYGAEIAYVEPLSERVSLEWSGVAGWHLEQLNQQTTDWIEEQPVQNILLTDIYNKEYNYQRLLTKLEILPKEKKKGFQYTLEAGVQRSQLRGVLISNNQEVDQSYYFPHINAMVIHRSSKMGSLNFSYRTRVVEPRVQQLQPLLNNQNPLYLQLGNPNLVPEFTHSFNLSKFQWNGTKGTNHYLNIGGSISQNAIVSTQTIDSELRTITQPINFGNRYSLYASGSYGGAIKKMLKYRVTGNVNWNQSPTFINSLQTKSSSQNYRGSVTLSNNKTKVVEASLKGTLVYRYNIIENNSSLNGASLNHDYRAKLRVTIAEIWNLGTEFSFYIFDDLNYQQQYQFPVWSAEASVLLLKDKSIKLILRGENLLNQQFMVNRQFLTNGITETRTNLLGRFVMLSLSYKINKMGGKENPMDRILIMD